MKVTNQLENIFECLCSVRNIEDGDIEFTPGLRDPNTWEGNSEGVSLSSVDGYEIKITMTKGEKKCNYEKIIAGNSQDHIKDALEFISYAVLAKA